MMKYVFKQIDSYTPSETTVEFQADCLETILEQFEMFLKGAGYQISGTLDIVYPEDDVYYNDDEEIDTSVMSHIVADLLKQNEENLLKENEVKTKWRHGWENTKYFPEEDVFGDIHIGEEVELNLSDYGAAQPIVSFDYYPQDSITISLDDIIQETSDKCELCGLDKSVMKLHKCFDEKCPLDDAK